MCISCIGIRRSTVLLVERLLQLYRYFDCYAVSLMPAHVIFASESFERRTVLFDAFPFTQNVLANSMLRACAFSLASFATASPFLQHILQSRQSFFFQLPSLLLRPFLQHSPFFNYAVTFSSPSFGLFQKLHALGKFFGNADSCLVQYKSCISLPSAVSSRRWLLT